VKKLLLLLALVYGHANSQQIKLTGKATDQQGQPVPFANVVLNTGVGSSTDLEGVYTLTLKPGVYSLEATSVGYKPIRVENVQANVDTRLDLTFEEDRTQLSEVVVTSVAQKETQVPWSLQ